MFSRSLALVSVSLLTACAPQDEASLPADAGPAFTGPVGHLFTFEGGGSDAVSWSWSLVELPSGSVLGPDSLEDAETPWPSLVPDAEGVYVLELLACDLDGQCALDWTEAVVRGTDHAAVEGAEVHRLQDDPDPLDFRPNLIRKGGSWSSKWGSGARPPWVRPAVKPGP